MKWLDRVLQRWRISKALAYIQPGDRVLDIGCAEGTLFKCLGSKLKQGTGYDPILTKPIEGPNYRLLPQGFPDGLKTDNVFDVITMLAVLEHIPSNQQGEIVSACHRHLRPGGRLVITVPSPKVDIILNVLRALRLIEGMSLEQHYGFEAAHTPSLVNSNGAFKLLVQQRFQIGLNNLFVFQKEPT